MRLDSHAFDQDFNREQGHRSPAGHLPKRAGVRLLDLPADIAFQVPGGHLDGRFVIAGRGLALEDLADLRRLPAALAGHGGIDVRLGLEPFPALIDRSRAAMSSDRVHPVTGRIAAARISRYELGRDENGTRFTERLLLTADRSL